VTKPQPYFGERVNESVDWEKERESDSPSIARYRLRVAGVWVLAPVYYRIDLLNMEFMQPFRLEEKTQYARHIGCYKGKYYFYYNDCLYEVCMKTTACIKTKISIVFDLDSNILNNRLYYSNNLEEIHLFRLDKRETVKTFKPNLYMNRSIGGIFQFSKYIIMIIETDDRVKTNYLKKEFATAIDVDLTHQYGEISFFPKSGCWESAKRSMTQIITSKYELLAVLTAPSVASKLCNLTLFGLFNKNFKSINFPLSELQNQQIYSPYNSKQFNEQGYELFVNGTYKTKVTHFSILINL